MPEIESLQQDRRYSLLLVIIGAGAILYGVLALLTERAPSPLLLFDPILGSALLAAGLLWGPFFGRGARAVAEVPEAVAAPPPVPAAPITPPPGARLEPPPIWLEDLEPALSESVPVPAEPAHDGVLLELDRIFEAAGRRRSTGPSAAPPDPSD